jgi:hypothetical protein
MKPRVYLLLFVMVFGVACGSSVSKSNTDTKTERTFNYPYSSVQAAARDAIQANGFEVTGEEPGFLTGHRPNQIGLLVGSGGENIGVWITSAGTSETKVQVVTKLTVVGVVGQRSWNDDVLKTIDEKLKAAAPPGAR